MSSSRPPSRRVRTAPRVPRDPAVDAWLLGTDMPVAQSTPLLPGDTRIVLTEQPSSPRTPGERVRAILALLSDPDRACECAEMRVIETPDYCVAEPGAGRTRGLGAAEDTSDEVYMRRNSKHERHERRLRRLEKEGLERERRRVAERIAGVEAMDLALLVPAMPQRSGEEARAVLEARRALLLADARATLARLDRLLAVPAVSAAPAAPALALEVPEIPARAFDDAMAAWLPDNRGFS